MIVRYVIFEVRLQDSILQMEESITSEAIAHGRLISWVAIDANAQKQTMTVLGAFSKDR